MLCSFPDFDEYLDHYITTVKEATKNILYVHVCGRRRYRMDRESEKNKTQDVIYFENPQIVILKIIRSKTNKQTENKTQNVRAIKIASYLIHINDTILEY